VLDATNKKVLDGAHSVSYYWQGKNSAATLFASTPPDRSHGPHGLPRLDVRRRRLEMYWDFYQKTLGMNVVAFPIMPSSRSLGWFKRDQEPAGLKGMKCAKPHRRPGVQRMGMARSTCQR